MVQVVQSGLSVLPYMRRRFDSLERRLRFRGATSAQARRWQRSTRRRLERLIGLDTLQPCDPRPRVTERVDAGDHFRERVEIHTEPDILMPVYVLIPKTGRPPYPVVICPHGHGGGGKAAVSGAGGHPDIEESIAVHRYDYGRAYCRAGFIACCPDARGFGERREILARDNVLASSCQWINHMALPLGQTVTGMWVWDLQRLIDYVETRPDCDAKRLGCAGLSGGGLQTLWTAALDTRIRAAVDSGYFYGVKEALLDQHGNCSCNYVPHLWEHVDMGDIAGLVAPRPFMIQTGNSDPLNGISGLENVTPQLEIARRVYRAFGAEDKLQHDVFEGPHRWDNTNSVPFLTRTLGAA